MTRDRIQKRARYYLPEGLQPRPSRSVSGSRERAIHPTQPAFPGWARWHHGLHQAGRAHTMRGQTRRHRWRSGLRTRALLGLGRPGNRGSRLPLRRGRQGRRALGRAAAGTSLLEQRQHYVLEGYNVRGRRIVIDEGEAAVVRYIFRRYQELGCVRLLKEDLDRRGVLSKRRTSKAGVESGGCSFSRGALYALLSNPIYVGEIRHKSICHPGQH